MAGREASERELLLGCRSGDPDAAAELMRRHQPALAATVVRLVGRRAVAEEIVQEAFLRVFQDIDRIDVDRGARAWLFRVALNLVRDFRKRRFRPDLAAEVPEAAEPLFAPVPRDPERALLGAEDRRLLEGALAALSPKLREVVLLRFVEGLSFPEIARVLHVPVSALKVRAFRARAQLLQLLGGSS